MILGALTVALAWAVVLALKKISDRLSIRLTTDAWISMSERRMRAPRFVLCSHQGYGRLRLTHTWHDAAIIARLHLAGYFPGRNACVVTQHLRPAMQTLEFALNLHFIYRTTGAVEQVVRCFQSGMNVLMFVFPDREHYGVFWALQHLQQTEIEVLSLVPDLDDFDVMVVHHCVKKVDLQTDARMFMKQLRNDMFWQYGNKLQ